MMLTSLLLLACHKDCPTYNLDADGDGYAGQEIQTCDPPEGASEGAIKGTLDCDDSDAELHPDQADGDTVCDGVDNDCDGQIDEDVSTWYFDGDGDGFGDTNVVESLSSCEAQNGYAAVAGDCDDTSAAIYPGAFEICSDGLDQDCDGAVGDADACALSGDVSLDALLALGGGWQMAGSSVAVLGDLDGDGLPDVAVGDGNLDVVTLVSGRTGASLSVLIGEAKSGFGGAVAAGDFDGDGAVDLAVGAPRAASGAGQVILFYGDAFSRSSVIDTRTSYRMFGLTLATLPVQGGADALAAELRASYDDQVVPTIALLAAPSTLADTSGAPKLGPFDVDSWPISLAVAPDGSALAVGYSGAPSGAAGASVYGLSDLTNPSLDAAFQTIGTDLGLGAGVALVDNGGTLTLLVGAPDASFGRGAVYALAGARSVGVAGVADADWAVAGTLGAMLGSGIGSIGDINGDGLPDLALGGQAQAWLLYGSETGFTDRSILGADADLSGFSDAVRAFQSAGDVNGDGYGDVLLSDGGTVTLLFGGPLAGGAAPALLPAQGAR